ncbi:hypothetical protein [Chitinimonas sp. BJYL2]|uniref:hypothetical protein n=1 Tax=Chitinimonas sp. BJYL2 TaxID=2976696 RepID=UPI0022B51350|nr:hypothetical protein [Chitinimonas sp. BJYL2]
MRPGAANVLVCPHCRQWLRCQAIDLHNRFDAEVWSDLRVVDTFWHTPADMVACTNCHQPFLRSQAERAGVLPSSIDELDFRIEDDGWHLLPRFGKSRELALLERYLSAPVLTLLSLEAVEAALPAARADAEIDLRLQCLRHHNDVRRHGHGEPWERLAPRFHANTERLLAILSPHDEFHQLMAAEILREYGEFHAAMQRLSCVQHVHGHEKAALMGWIIERRTELMPF